MILANFCLLQSKAREGGSLPILESEAGGPTSERRFERVKSAHFAYYPSMHYAESITDTRVKRNLGGGHSVKFGGKLDQKRGPIGLFTVFSFHVLRRRGAHPSCPTLCLWPTFFGNFCLRTRCFTLFCEDGAPTSPTGVGLPLLLGNQTRSNE